MELPFGITISFSNGNGKYMKKEDCKTTHESFNEHFDTKLRELALDRNQKLSELKSDLIEHINLRIESLRK